MNLKGFLKLLSSKSEFLLLAVIILLAFILRMLWLNTSIEGDEGYFAYTAWLWDQGKILYVDIFAEKGPLLYLLHLLPIHFFGNSIIPIRIENNILFLVSIFVLYLIARDWSGKKAGLIAALFYSLFMNAPFYGAHQAMAESFSIPFVIFSVYIGNRYLKNGNRILLLIAAIFMSAALLIRQNQGIGILLLVIIIAIARYRLYKENHQTKWSFAGHTTADLLILTVGIILPISAFLVYFWSHGAISELVKQTVLNFLPGSAYFAKANVNYGIKFLDVAQGLPLWLFAFLGLIACILKQKNYRWRAIIPFSWFLLFLMVAGIPPNYGHHFSIVIAPAAICVGISLGLVLDNIKSKSITSLFSEYEKNITNIFLIILLLFSFIPAIFFSVKQYPNSNINWEFVSWVCTGNVQIVDYKQQLEIAEYLNKNTIEEDNILIHAWGGATIYWLTGHEAPSKHTFLRPPFTPKVPLQEVDRVLKMISERNFKSILLFAQNITKLDSTDPIVKLTLNKYYYIQNIGNAYVYEKYSLEGEYAYYSFIEEYPDAIKEYDLPDGNKGNTIEAFKNEAILIPVVSSLTVNSDNRPTLFQHPLAPQGTFTRNSYVNYTSVIVPEKASIKFAISTTPSTWTNAGDGVQFKIIIKDNEINSEVFSKYIDPKHNIEDRKWHEYEIDLANYVNKTIDIAFVTNPGLNNNSSSDWAHWGSPTIVVSVK